MEKLSYLERLNHWARHSVTLKLFSIGFLILLLLIPSGMITGLIYERESTRDEAVKEVSSKWGGSQELSGPVISVPYSVYNKDKDGQTVTSVRYAHFLPDQLDISGKILPEKRYRGIYVVVLYNGKLHVEANFKKLNLGALHIPEENLRFSEAVLTFGITDMKGIRSNLQVTVNGERKEFGPGLPTHDIFASGVSLPLDSNHGELNFKMDMDINGSSALAFLPLGKETSVSLESGWSDPKFEGAFLPETRQVTESGFTAKWHILELNRNYPQQGTGAFTGSMTNEDDNILSGAGQNGSFGVKLLLPVDEYQKTMRSAKYCLMFIIITFLTFFFVEVFSRKRMHPVQYLLVGFAIVLFYILLLSVSEHLSFNTAYLVSCAVILLLVSFYAGAVFRDTRVAAMIFGLLGMLYGFFYSLLQLQDYALLMGSLGLLLILAVIMAITRNIDWYNLGNRDPGSERG